MSSSLWPYGQQALQALLSTTSQSLLRFMSIVSVMLSNHLIFYHPLLLLSSLFPSIRVFSNESALLIHTTVYLNDPPTIGYLGCFQFVIMINIVMMIVSVTVQSLSCVKLCDSMDCSTPGFSVLQLPEFTQTHVHRVGDAIQPSHPLSSPSPPALNLSQHQGLFQWVSSSYQVAKVSGLQHLCNLCTFIYMFI